MDVKKKIHTKLVNACKQLGKEHAKCSIPGCEGYIPANKRSFLENRAGLQALADSIPFQSDWTKFDEKRAKGNKRTKDTKGTKVKTAKGTSQIGITKTKKTKSDKQKTIKTKKTKSKKKSFLEDAESFFALQAEHKKETTGWM